MKGVARTLVLAIIIIAVLSLLIYLGYSQSWTGFQAYVDSAGEYHPTKMLWDWIELLIIPVVLLVGALLLVGAIRTSEHESADQRARAERAIAEERNRELVLQANMDRIAEWMLASNLQDSQAVRDVARARTLSALRVLDNHRKGLLVQFLYESELINGHH